VYGNCAGGGLALQALAGNSNFAAAGILYGYVRSDLKSTEPPPAAATDAWAKMIAWYGKYLSTT